MLTTPAALQTVVRASWERAKLSCIALGVNTMPTSCLRAVVGVAMDLSARVGSRPAAMAGSRPAASALRAASTSVRVLDIVGVPQPLMSFISQPERERAQQRQELWCTCDSWTEATWIGGAGDNGDCCSGGVASLPAYPFDDGKLNKTLCEPPSSSAHPAGVCTTSRLVACADATQGLPDCGHAQQPECLHVMMAEATHLGPDAHMPTAKAGAQRQARVGDCWTEANHLGPATFVAMATTAQGSAMRRLRDYATSFLMGPTTTKPLSEPVPSPRPTQPEFVTKDCAATHHVAARYSSDYGALDYVFEGGAAADAGAVRADARCRSPHSVGERTADAGTTTCADACRSPPHSVGGHAADAGAMRAEACCAPPHSVGGRATDAGAARADAHSCPPRSVSGHAADARRAIPYEVDGCAADASGGLDLDYVFEGDAARGAGGATCAVWGGA